MEDRKRSGKRGIPADFQMDVATEISPQTHENTLGHDQSIESGVEDGPETEVTGDETGKAAVGTTAAADPSPIKKRGRPKGAKNKPKPSPRRLREPFPVKIRKKKSEKKTSSDKMVMVRFTTCIPSDLIERMKNCVYYSPGKTVTEVVSSGVRKELNLLEKKNRGKFKDRPNTELNAGRKVK